MDLTWAQIAGWAARPTPVATAVAFLAFASILSPLERLWPAKRQAVRRQGFGTDLFFWVFTPLVGKVLTFTVVSAIVVGLMSLTGREFHLTSTEGWGPVGRQPLWLQAIEVLFLADFIFYWAHRCFHTCRLWPFHAVHHSNTHMDWLTSMRFHPVNDVISRTCQAVPLVLIGFAPAAVVCIIPVILAFIVITHANLPWTWGPLRYVFISPVYHHWHHSIDEKAVDMNFAGVFVIWDWLFGTLYMPADRRPQEFGVIGEGTPAGPVGLLVSPFLAKEKTDLFFAREMGRVETPIRPGAWCENPCEPLVSTGGLQGTPHRTGHRVKALNNGKARESGRIWRK